MPEDNSMEQLGWARVGEATYQRIEGFSETDRIPSDPAGNLDYLFTLIEEGEKRGQL